MAWEDLLAVYDEQRQALVQEATTPPVACPNDGEPLIPDRLGRPHCRFDGYVWDGIPT